MHVDTDSQKLLIRNLLDGHGQKWMWLVWSWDSKIDFIAEMKRWNELFFLHAVTNSGKLKFDSMIFGWAWSKMEVPFLVHVTLTSAVLRINL